MCHSTTSKNCVAWLALMVVLERFLLHAVLVSGPNARMELIEVINM